MDTKRNGRYIAHTGTQGAGLTDNQQGVMTMGTQKITVTVTNKDFGYAIKFLKKRGYTFNANEKTWSGTGDIAFLIDEAYVLELKN